MAEHQEFTHPCEQGLRRLTGGPLPDGSPGAWLADHRSLLMLGPIVRDRIFGPLAFASTMLTVARRPDGIRCLVTSADPNDLSTPGGRLRMIGRGRPVPFEEVLRAFAKATLSPDREWNEDEAWMGVPFAPMQAFLRTLDQEALRIRAARCPDADRVYDALDATVDPEAPLRRALEARPDHAPALVRAHLADPAGLRAAALGGGIDKLLMARAKAEWGLSGRTRPR